MAVGNTGEYLEQAADEMCTWMSPDGGATWQPVPGSWNTTGVADGSYDIRVTVRDAAGNDSNPSGISSRLVDNTKPVTTASGVPSGFSSSAVTVTLNPSDAGSGVNDTQYKVDTGTWQAGTSVVVPAPADGSNDGAHTITFYSLDAAGNIVGAGDVRAQIEQVFATLQAALEAAGATFADVVKLTYYLLDVTQLPLLRDVRDCYVNPQAPPASTLVEVRRLARDEFLVEIEAIASVRA